METLVRASADAAGAARNAPIRMPDPRSAATILLVEVEALLMDSIKYTLERDGHRIVVAVTRAAGLAAVAVERPGLVVADLGQLSTDVADFCRKARSLSAAPIILITPEVVSDADRAEALQAGADDLLARPFSLREVAHRVGAQLRGGRAVAARTDNEDEVLRVGPLELDVANHEVRVRGTLTEFPPKEFALLETLMRSRGRLVRRERLIWMVWGANYYGDGKTLDTHVKRLRKKIESDPRRPQHLVVVRGMGYRLLDGELSA
jgi:two-component system response regulator RegX3